MADVALHKGRGEEEVVQQAADNIRRLGYNNKIVVKTDNEPALLSLRDEVVKLLDIQAVPEAPPVEDSLSAAAGSVEAVAEVPTTMLAQPDALKSVQVT